MSFRRRDWVVMELLDEDDDPHFLLVPRGTRKEDMARFGDAIPVLCYTEDGEAAELIAAAVNTFTDH